MFETIWDSGDEINEPKLKFQRVTDFLRIGEGEFFAFAAREPALQGKIRRLQSRALLRRALHISAAVIVGPLQETAYSDLVRLGSGEPGATEEIRSIRQEIFDALPADARRETNGHGNALDVHDVWLDIPDTPRVSPDILRCYVDTGEEQPKRLTDLFPIDAWLRSYAENKWNAHVFGYPDDKHLRELNKAAVDVLQTRFQLKFEPLEQGDEILSSEALTSHKDRVTPLKEKLYQNARARTV
ncbi:MAG: hypothetical protein IH888_05090 [Planctomycetes bacterium]|nr:hypothetical protein [Planctomycetota bacterium]